MKKSIKYAGIAAATLLAVAPVAAPVLSSTTNVNAAVVNGKTSDEAALTQSLGKFDGKFGGTREAADGLANKNIDNVKLNNSGSTYAEFMGSQTANWLADESKDTAVVDGANVLTLDDIKNGTGDTFNAGVILGQTTKQNESDVAAANVRNIVVTAKETLADGSVVDVNSTANLKQGLADVDGVTKVEVTTSYDYTDTNNQKQSSSTTLTLTNTKNALSAVNVNYTTPFNVALNQTVTSSKLLSGTDLKFTDQNGKTLLSSDAVPSDNFFDSARGASQNMSSATVDNDVVTTDKYSTNGVTYNKTATFKKAGTWYQSLTVSFPANGSLSNYLALAMTNSQQNPLTINGVKFGSINTDTFDFIKNGDDAITGMRFARAINVSNDSSQWTVTDAKGVVTTKPASNYYTLKNADNVKITNRALAPNSAWKTDQKRTDQNGNVQYRVATNEWIDAAGVTFGDSAATDNGSTEGAYTDVKEVNGKVTLAGPAGFMYMLYSDNGVVNGSRALSGDSGWKTDKVAKNANGTTVYRVATNEWVQVGNGVNYVAY